MKISAARFYFAFTMQIAGMVGGAVGAFHHASSLVWTSIIVILIGNFTSTHLFREAAREAETQCENDE